jgi:fructose-1,6-bisphosphatase/inositol monophosphatase family enzyme
MVAVEFNQSIIAAAITLPSLNFILTADNESPTTLNGKPINVVTANLNKTTLIVDSGKTTESKQRLSTYLSKHETKFRSIRRFGCVASHAAMLRSGQPFASIIIGASAHDLCPISLIFKQAGLTTLNTTGSPWTPNDPDLISFHQYHHPKILTTLIDLTTSQGKVIKLT